MPNVLQKPKTIFEVWESLPEGTLCQLINNNIVMSPAPKQIHQFILGRIYFQLSKSIEENNNGIVYLSPFDIHFSKRNILQPDIVFISNSNLHLIEEKGLIGVPDIIVEILSPSTAHYDEGDKRAIYEQYGVKEYCMVDPTTKKVTTLFLDGKEFVEKGETIGNFYSKLLDSTIVF